MADIFICYRRNDSEGYVGRLHDHLQDRFGARALFVDVDSLHPGVDFEQVIERTLLRSTIVLVVIGPRWLDQRLKDENDWVRREIIAALRGKKRLIPILVGGARMPAREKLPPELASLAGKHSVTLHHPTWKADVSRLVTSLEKILASRKRVPKAAAGADPTPKRVRPAAQRRKKPDAAAVAADKPPKKKVTVVAPLPGGKTTARPKKKPDDAKLVPPARRVRRKSSRKGTAAAQAPVKTKPPVRREEQSGTSGKPGPRRKKPRAGTGAKPGTSPPTTKR